MSDLLCENYDHLCILTLNRISKHNAFDNHLLKKMQHQLDSAIADPSIRVIVLKANGSHFSAGADLAWMQAMVHFNEEENRKDSLILAQLMHTIYKSPKPTVAMVHGYAFGGGAGLAAACDITLAAKSARFCFSEVKIGLIPAVISPYVIRAIGERNAAALFMSAEIFDTAKALSINLIQHCLPEEELLDFTINYAKKISSNAPLAVQEAKKLVRDISKKTIDEELNKYTATLIANKRVSPEGQKGLSAFLKKTTPDWS